VHGSRNTPLGEDFDAPPARRRRAAEHVEGRLLGQLPDPNLGEFRGDPGDPGLHLRGHLGEVLAQRLGEHLRLQDGAARRSAAMIIVGGPDSSPRIPLIDQSVRVGCGAA
jgi:hypothetical protein